MEFDFASLTGAARNKLMHAVVLPRPIALVVTRGPKGVNAAPFSFFNVFSGDPAVVAVGIGASTRNGHGLKDTAANILETRELVVNMVTEDMAQAMNVTAAEFSHGENELELAELSVCPSVRVSPPRISCSPVALECELIQSIPVEGGRYIFLARVVTAHIDDDLVLDGDRYYIDGANLGLIARMHGGGWYARTTDLFQMNRLHLSDVEGRAD